MNEIMTMAIEFFFAHSVIICVVFGILLVVSSAIFLKRLSKRNENKKVSKKNDEPVLDELEKMYLNSFKN